MTKMLLINFCKLLWKYLFLMLFLRLLIKREITAEL